MRALRDGKVELLARTALLAACTADEHRTIARAGDLVHAPPGAVLAAAGDRLAPIVLVASGSACAIGPEGATVCDDAVLAGAAEVLAGAPRRDDVVATTDVDVFVLDPRRLEPLLRACPGLGLALLRFMTVVSRNR